MLKVGFYLNFPGNTEEAFLFYRSVFGGEFKVLQRFGDAPGMDPGMASAYKDKIMHVALPLGDHGEVLMGTDALEGMGQQVVMGNNFYISLHPSEKSQADRLFAALSTGGTVEMPLQDTFWGAYYGSLKDRFGVQWMINCVPHS